MHKSTIIDNTKFCRSTFTLTFAIEILNIEVWNDCPEMEWLDLGPYVQGMKLQYQLYPGQTYDIDILIWPHTVKIWCGTQYGWVRTWKFLESRWLTFSIRHVFPVRVLDLRNHTATVTVNYGMGSLSANAKNDKNFRILLCPLSFGERRYFASVADQEEILEKFIEELIWNTVVEHIPTSYLDGLFDAPHTTSDIRHQDAVLFHVKENILHRNILEEEEELSAEVEMSLKGRDGRESKVVKEKDKKKAPETQKVKFEIKLPGDTILAGTGRIIPFETFGDRPPDLGEIIVLISSCNLPAQDDLPIVFVNVESLQNIPVKEFKKLGILQLYTRWKIGEEEHDSQPQPLKVKNEINFNDHHAIPLQYNMASEFTATFLDQTFEIQLRGIRNPPNKYVPSLFGYEKNDHEFGQTAPPADTNDDLDIIIAITIIDGSSLSKGISGFIRGEYSFYPPRIRIPHVEREAICTNDINAIGLSVQPKLIVPPSLILESQIMLEVSLGLVGCRSRKLTRSFSRLFCLINDTNVIMTLLRYITDINGKIAQEYGMDALLTGFAIDTGDVAILFVEGPKDGHILKIWEKTEDFYDKLKPTFSSSARYPTRIYSELPGATLPFMIMKMYVPLSALLICPAIYVRPALPLPVRSALLKLGRLIGGKFQTPPYRCDLPTMSELNSFRLELCVPPRSLNSMQLDNQNLKLVPSMHRIYHQRKASFHITNPSE